MTAGMQDPFRSRKKECDETYSDASRARRVGAGAHWACGYPSRDHPRWDAGTRWKDRLVGPLWAIGPVPERLGHLDDWRDPADRHDPVFYRGWAGTLRRALPERAQ